MYQVVTHEEAKKYKDYLLSGTTASPKAIIYNTKIALETKLATILSNKDFFDEDGLLKDDFFEIFKDIKIKIIKCELLTLGVKSYPVSLNKPKYKKSSHFFELPAFIIRTLKVQDNEEENSLAQVLSKDYPSKIFWSNMFLDENFKVNSLNWFMSINGQLFLKQHSSKQS